MIAYPKGLIPTHRFHGIFNSLILTVIIAKGRNFENVQKLKLGDKFQRDKQAVLWIII